MYKNTIWFLNWFSKTAKVTKKGQHEQGETRNWENSNWQIYLALFCNDVI